MVDFIFVMLMVFILMLGISMVYSNIYLGILSSIGLIVIGLVGLINGYLSYKNFTTEVLSIILMMVGSYITIVTLMGEIDGQEL